jgi:hypothetical protein
MNEYLSNSSNKDVSEANETLLGKDTLVVSCNHGWARQFELARNIETILQTKGIAKKVCTLPGGWFGVVSTMYTRENQVDSPAYLFFEQLRRDGKVITTSEHAYHYYRDQLKLRGLTRYIDQVIYIHTYADEQEIIANLQAAGII